jgi:hypothetical protein
MYDIKFWKGNENQRSVYKKTVFRNFERFLPFLTFFSSQKSSLSLLRDENFFSLNRSNGASKNPSFRTDFKNVNLTLVKVHPKKVLAKKLFYQLKICLSPKKICFLGKTFYGCTFYQGHMYIFEISMKRRIF